MRLVIKEYLSRLKEKDELDFLICDLLLQMGYIMDNRPETGNRQYGVDVRAYNRNEVLLCVIKQGKLTRTIWDSGQNSVRQSLNEIQDVYRRNMTMPDRKKQLRIAVITNDTMDEAAIMGWNGYVNDNVRWGETNVKIEFWGIDKLVDDVEKYLFEEKLFGPERQSMLRKALYFIEGDDYRNVYFEQIIDGYISELSETDKEKACDKKLASLYLATQMIAQYAANAQVYKIAIMVSEYLLIRYWKYLLEHQLFQKKLYMEWLIKFLQAYEKWNDQYFEAVHFCCEGENQLPLYHSVEQRVILYEMVGYLTSYAYYLCYKGSRTKRGETGKWEIEDKYHLFHEEEGRDSREKVADVYNSIMNLIGNHPQFNYPPYDGHIGIISMLYRLMDYVGHADSVCELMDQQCTRILMEYRLHRRYPAQTDTFEEALCIYQNQENEYKCSGLWGGMLQWMVAMDQKELYEKCKANLQEDFKDVTKCAWFLREDEETKFYDAYAMNLAGDGTCFEVEKDFDSLKKQILFFMKQYQKETFSYETYSFPALEFIVSRYYGYTVRIMREKQEK